MMPRAAKALFSTFGVVVACLGRLVDPGELDPPRFLRGRGRENSAAVAEDDVDLRPGGNVVFKEVARYMRSSSLRTAAGASTTRAGRMGRLRSVGRGRHGYYWQGYGLREGFRQVLVSGGGEVGAGVLHRPVVQLSGGWSPLALLLLLLLLLLLRRATRLVG